MMWDKKSMCQIIVFLVVYTVVLLNVIHLFDFNYYLRLKSSMKHVTTWSHVPTKGQLKSKLRNTNDAFRRGINFSEEIGYIGMNTSNLSSTTRNTWQLSNFSESTKRKHGDITSNRLTTDERIFKIVPFGLRHGMLVKQSRAVDFQKCHYYKNCEITMQNLQGNNYLEADAILFQGGRIPKKIPRHRDEKQVFIFTSIESPEYLAFTSLKNNRYNYYFNWTMTYRVDSSIPYLYGSVVPKSFRFENMKPWSINTFLDMHKNSTYIDDIYNNPVDISGKNYSFIFNQKEKSALWLVSHCTTSSKREKYIKEMQKYMEIDVVGLCNKNGTVQCPKQTKGSCEDFLTRQYKFYLSFENSICNDYITEKAFNWFTRDIVIVVRGARNYSKHLPTGTYVDSNDFETPKDMALFLNRLGSNKTEYTRILKRKDRFKVIDMGQHSQLSYCNLCYKLNNLNHNKDVIPDIHQWWTNQMCVNGKQLKDLN